MKSKYNYDVIIIGSGPAGISSAIYLKRAGINPLILEKDIPGGMLNKTTKIENYPGYTDKKGTILAFKMYSQIEELEINSKIETVLDIKKEKNIYKVITNRSQYYSKYIIIASGKIPRKLDVVGSDKFEKNGISYCAICDGFLYKNKNVAVIGGGNSALEAANYLSSIAKKVYLINRSNILKADKKEQDNIFNNNNVELIMNSKVTEIISINNELVGIKLNESIMLDVSGIFVYIGQESNSAYYQNLGLKTDKRGILVNCNMKTNKKNIYAIGDAISKDLYQIVTAVSEGAIASTNIIKSINFSI